MQIIFEIFACILKPRKENRYSGRLSWKSIVPLVSITELQFNYKTICKITPKVKIFICGAPKTFPKGKVKPLKIFMLVNPWRKFLPLFFNLKLPHNYSVLLFWTDLQGNRSILEDSSIAKLILYYYRVSPQSQNFPP